MSTFRYMFGALALGLLTACGGGGSTNNNQPPVNPPASVAEGLFMDSPVAGLAYTSGGQSGTTGSRGQFTYEVGQTVAFSIGNIKLPTVAGGTVITPLTLFKTNSYNDTRVVNLARLLQTMDLDADPSNGISLSPVTVTAAANIVLTDFSTANFDSTVQGIATAAGRPLVDAATALTHMQGQSIVGSWVIGGQFSPDTENNNSTDISQGNGFQVITFWPDGTYLHGATRATGTAWQPGIERGTYSWDPATGTTVFKTVTDKNGSWGPSAGAGTATMTLAFKAGDTNTIEVPGATGKVITLKRVRATGSIVGTWGGNIKAGSPADYVSIVFLPTGEFMFLEESTDDLAHGTPGIEWGTYTWDAGTGRFTPTFKGDTCGEWGFSHPIFGGLGYYSITLNGSSMTLTDGSAPNTVPRLEP